MNGSRFEALVARLNDRIDWEKLERGAGWKVDLAPARDLLDRLGRPDEGLRIVHVAGSKGKGSTSAMVAAGIARALGPGAVGVYSSPHVETIRERIAIDGAPIGEGAFADALEAVLDAADGAPDAAPCRGASWFDLMTGVGLVAFRAAGLRWAVLEVGLGGRLDSTNAIRASEVAVVTTIALEHTKVLGDTHAAIAREKAGILRPGGRAVTGCAPDSDAGRAIAEVAAALGASLRFAHDPADRSFEDRNARVARAALGEAGFDPALLDDAAIRGARLPGRMEERRFGEVPVLLDGAHVAESLAEVVAAGVERLGPRFVAVVAVHREKDAARLLAPIVAAGASIVATDVPGSRVHRTAREIADVARSGHGVEVDVAPDPTAALAEAAGRASGHGWVLATGSLYLVGAVRSATGAIPHHPEANS